MILPPALNSFTGVSYTSITSIVEGKEDLVVKSEDTVLSVFSSTQELTVETNNTEALLSVEDADILTSGEDSELHIKTCPN